MEETKITKKMKKEGRMCLHCLHRNTVEIKPNIWECKDCQTKFVEIPNWKKERDKRVYK